MTLTVHLYKAEILMDKTRLLSSVGPREWKLAIHLKKERNRKIVRIEKG